MEQLLACLTIVGQFWHPTRPVHGHQTGYRDASQLAVYQAPQAETREGQHNAQENRCEHFDGFVNRSIFKIDIPLKYR